MEYKEYKDNNALMMNFLMLRKEINLSIFIIRFTFVT